MTCGLLFRILKKIQVSTGVDYTSTAYLTGIKTKNNFWKSIILVAEATKSRLWIAFTLRKCTGFSVLIFTPSIVPEYDTNLI